MGDFFDAFLTGLKKGRERAQNEAYRRQDKNNFPVRLIEPSTGRVVELEVIEQNDRVAQMYMDQLKTYAECLEHYGVQWTFTGKKIRIVFNDDNMAENARQTWRK